MTGYYRFRTRVGEFRIVPGRDGRWHLWHGDDCFDGHFKTAQEAAEQLANGYSAWPACGDPSRLGIPEDLSDWELSRR